MCNLNQLLSFLACAGVVAIASPITESPSVAADLPPWTIKSFTRTCNEPDTICNVSYAIDANDGQPSAACAYNVTGSPASQTHTQGIDCGPYMVGSNWSGQFGPGNGFTVFPVLNYVKNQLAFPSYADEDLVNGVAVSPDRSFAVQQFPVSSNQLPT